jgi:hypothetical protein
MKVLDKMVMHNGIAGITVGVIVLEVDGKVLAFGAISSARRGVDEWNKATGLNKTDGRLVQVVNRIKTLGLERGELTLDLATFKMGEFGGDNIRKNLFGPIRDIVRDLSIKTVRNKKGEVTGHVLRRRPKRSIMSLRNRLIRTVNPAYVSDNIVFEATAADAMEDDGLIVPTFAARACGAAACGSSEPSPARIASRDDNGFVPVGDEAY